jgi:hypothetical protein
VRCWDKTLSAAAVALIASVAAPSFASASTGGGSGGTGVPTNAATAVPASGPQLVENSVQKGNVSVTASGNGITVRSIASAILFKGLQFSGSVPASVAGQRVVIERNGHETGWSWEPTVSTTARSDGSFSATWRTNHIGRFSIRVLITTGSSTATAAAASPAMTVTVYRPSIATLYGPGFWGRRTACGMRLTRSTIGVANRTLKCGEDVSLYYKGKTLIVPVIDRGPYANNADWDLTMATGKALGIEGTTKLGAVSLPPQPAQ